MTNGQQAPLHPEQRSRSVIVWALGAWVLAFGISLTAFAVGLFAAQVG